MANAPCWPVAEFPDRKPEVWTEALNRLPLHPNDWTHPDELPLRLTATLVDGERACQLTPAGTEWWVELALVSESGAIFSRRTQVSGETEECAGCYRLRLQVTGPVQDVALVFDAAEAPNVTQVHAELTASVVGSGSRAAMASGSLIVRYRLSAEPAVERERRFEF